MNKDENEQKNYSSHDVRKEAVKQQDQQFYEANKNALNTASNFNPYVAAVNEADKKTGRLGTKIVSKSPIKNLPEFKTFSNIGGSKGSKIASNIISVAKGKKGDAAKDAASNSLKDKNENANKPLSPNDKKDDKLKDNIEKNKQSNATENQTKEKIKEKEREKAKEQSEEDEEEKKNDSSNYSEDFEKDVKSEKRKSALINGLITLFGGTPMVVTIIFAVIFSVLTLFIFAGIYTAIIETEEDLKAESVGDISSTATLTASAQGDWTIFSVVESIKNGTLIEDIKGTINVIKNKFKNTFDLFANLGNIFSSDIACEGDDCKLRAEVQFYQKVSHITERYKKVYGVELDWPLLVSTVIVNSIDKEKTFAENLGGYNESDVKNINKITSLDWEYDYKNIPGYDYLSGNDSRYDLQILAKNMVKKTVTQTCKNANGEDLVEPLILYDVEDVLISEDLNNYYYSECKNKKGKYNKEKPIYQIDKDKYDEFLDEYLEMKFFENVDGGYAGSNEGGGGVITGGDTSNSKYGYSKIGNTNFGSPLANAVVSSDYGLRKSGFHCGIDFKATEGTPVYAIADGIVTSIETNCVVGVSSCGDGAGNHVLINHGNGFYSSSMHASKVLVNVGQQVKRGDIIMLSGNTGSSTGPHFHLSMRAPGAPIDNAKCSKGNWVNPWPYIGGN